MNWFHNKTAVVPVDFGDQSRWAIDTALEIIGKPANVHVVHVGTDLTEMVPVATWDTFNENAMREHLEQLFEKEFPEEKYRQLPFQVRYGDPGREITSFAEERGADLIVMPSHGRTGLTRLLIGSVAERVVRLAHCPVLILRR